MTGIEKLAPKLKTNALKREMTILTPEEAQAVHDHIDNLEYRLECCEEKVLLTMQNCYDLVQLMVKLRRQIEALGAVPAMRD